MKTRFSASVWAPVLVFASSATGFSCVQMNAAQSAILSTSRRSSSFGHTSLAMSTAEENATNVEVSKIPADTTADLTIPMTFDEMIRQSTTAMEDAYKQRINRQILRILLPRSAANERLLQLIEDDVQVELRNSVLVPPDESWQGGIMQLYRVASLSCQEMLRRYARNAAGGVPPRLVEDRTVDESGVDGVGLWMTQGAAAKDDVSCFVQPSQESVDAIEAISKQAGSRLVTLVNPQWRIADDALDVASKSGGAWGNLASFLGGKGGSLRRLEELGFQSTFILEGYVCRGSNVRMIKRFDSDWAVFAENDDATNYVKVGSMAARPTYQDIDAMLEKGGISLKYAREIGLTPKV